MHERVIRRAAAAAFSLLIAASLVAYADQVPADGDSITPGSQTVIDLGSAAPGDVLIRQVTFSLLCAGVSHATPGSTIAVDFDSAIVPGDGAADATNSTIGPVPASWASSGCTTPAQTLAANAPSTVSLTMPTTAGPDQDFTLMWADSGSTGLTGMTTLTFRVDVIGNTAPTLHLPGNQLVEATSAAGAAVSWSASATDDEDENPPAVTCSPASGSTFHLGTTTVTCSTKDSGGLTAKDSFVVTVQDTTAPVFVLPGPIDVTTDDPAGAAVDYGVPSIVEVVDPDPTFGCVPASGSIFPVGTTAVVCTARDASGNEGSQSFDITVRYVPAVSWTASWGEPVATNGSTFVANPGRTVPVKVRIFANGVEETAGSASLSFGTCAGPATGTMAMTYGGGRWNASLDTGALGAPGCYLATASLDGNVAGTFRIDLRGADPATANAPKVRTKP
ncbi:MAG TPA: HYR domain-containing protein [Candidatus Limnocylindrales bacterium]|nr:HYR domain-containing protein [Candidatus Limnocylindrales bacterium]